MVFFVDFDGTVTLKDTCDAMSIAYGEGSWMEANRLWEEKKLSTADCARMILKHFKVSPEDLRQFLGAMEIDRYFKDFLSLCREKGHEVYILSDGYDFNIETVLSKHGIDIKYYSNKLLYSNENGYSIESPYEDGSCKSCGTCKANLVKSLKKDGELAVYIGDGYSDFCPAELADKVFAKGTLYRYCRDHGINAVPFENFNDIIANGII